MVRRWIRTRTSEPLLPIIIYNKAGLIGQEDPRIKNPDYTTASIPMKLAEKIDEVMNELGFWPSRSAFVRDACIEKIERITKK